MKVLKFGAGLFENEQNLSRVKEVVEASEGRVVIVAPERHINSLREIIPGSQVVPPQICLAGHPEIFTPYSQKVIVPGIIPDGLAVSELTDLEVGASDYLASLIAASNDAESLEIWTDKDGFMTADPASVKTAYLIKEMSYREAMELCNFGVGLIYSPALFPVNSKGIPTVVRNLFNPDGPGTTIKKECPSGEQVIRGISSIDNVSLITLSGTSMAGVVGVNCRIFTALALERISAFLVCQSASETGISIGVSAKDALKAKAVLDGTFAREIENGSLSPMKIKDGLAAVSVIGDNMKNTPGTAGKLFATLGRNGISVSAFAQDASESNISFIVDRTHLRKSLNVIHDSFFLSEYQELNLFLCGIGTVGSRLIAQIQGQRQKLMDEHNLKINVVGIARSVKAVFDRDGIDLPDWKERLENGIPITPAKLRDEVIGMNIFNSVFVDCTASAEIASLYEDFLNRGISVVAANKIAASSDYSVYKRLKDISRLRGVKFLFETNVGAGLPIIGTINDLRNSGDRILKMEAVVSGTLNFIFNNLSEDITFSQAVRMAKEQGFSEPDPRMDLSGTDVIRKLVILSREAGYEVNMDDVQANLFIPQSFFECSLDEFWAKLPELDAKFEADRKRLMEEDKRWRFVAVNDHGKCSVSLREIPMRHSFYVLDGSNNIILLTTERYNKHPMLIQGYGAGAEVTAAGVFADIMSIANIR
jgi:aspartokinase/homoserine dehydrogenase 1